MTFFFCIALRYFFKSKLLFIFVHLVHIQIHAMEYAVCLEEKLKGGLFFLSYLIVKE